MVQLENVGIMITLVMLISGNFMAVIAEQDPEGESFGMNPNLDATTVGQSDIDSLLDQFNSDLEQISSPDPFTQIRFGGLAIVTGARIMIALFISAFTNWLVLIDLLFAFINPVTEEGKILLRLVLPIKALIGFIMAFTIMKFLGDIVRSLPFFGGR